MSHGRIFEIRAARPFSADEAEYGTMNPDNVFLSHQDIFDYIAPDLRYEQIVPDRDAETFLMPLLCDVFTRDGLCLTLSQPRYDDYVERLVRLTKEAALQLTPQAFYDSSQYRTLLPYLPLLPYESAYVYDEQEGDIISCREFILKSSSYRNPDGDCRRFYIGKVWDFKW